MKSLGLVNINNGTGSLKCTIPNRVVKKLGLVVDDELLFCEDEGGNVVIKKNGGK